jgi:hypothetical protein
MLAILHSLGCSSETCSSRGACLRPRTCFSVINSASPAIFCGRQFQGRSSWMPLAGIWQSREHIGEPGLQIIRNGPEAQRPDRRLYDLYNRNWLGYGRDSSLPPLRSARTRAACAGFLAGAQIRHRVDLDQAVRAQGVDRHRQPGRHPRAAQASSELFAVGIEEHLAILSR